MTDITTPPPLVVADLVESVARARAAIPSGPTVIIASDAIRRTLRRVNAGVTVNSHTNPPLVFGGAKGRKK